MASSSTPDLNTDKYCPRNLDSCCYVKTNSTLEHIMTQLDLDAKEPLLSEKSVDEDEQDHDSDDNEREHEPGSDHEETHRSRTPAQRRGRNRRDSYGGATGPSSSRRPFLFIACFLVAIWLAYSVHLHRARKAKRSNVIYASRYVLVSYLPPRASSNP